MRLYGLLQLVIALLRYKGRLTYAALQHEFGLDDATLDAIRHELIFAERVATDEAGRVLVWAGEKARRLFQCLSQLVRLSLRSPLFPHW